VLYGMINLIVLFVNLAKRAIIEFNL